MAVTSDTDDASPVPNVFTPFLFLKILHRNRQEIDGCDAGQSAACWGTHTCAGAEHDNLNVAASIWERRGGHHGNDVYLHNAARDCHRAGRDRQLALRIERHCQSDQSAFNFLGQHLAQGSHRLQSGVWQMHVAVEEKNAQGRRTHTIVIAVTDVGRE